MGEHSGKKERGGRRKGREGKGGREDGREEEREGEHSKNFEEFPCPSCSAASLEPPYGRLISIETGTVNHFPENTAGTYYWNNFL